MFEYLSKSKCGILIVRTITLSNEVHFESLNCKNIKSWFCIGIIKFGKLLIQVNVGRLISLHSMCACVCLRVFVYNMHAFRICRQTHDRVLAFRFQFKKLMNECAAFDKRIDFIRAFCVYFVVTVLLSGFFFVRISSLFLLLKFSMRLLYQWLCMPNGAQW